MGANIFQEAANIFHLSARVWRKVFKFAYCKSKVCKEQSKVQKAKVKDKKVIMCYPQALRMPLYKECKKLFISSSSPIIIISHFRFPLPPQQNSPPPPPLPSHGWAWKCKKGTERMQLFCEAVAIGRGGVSGSHPAFFLPIATTSNKKFWKWRNCKWEMQMLWIPGQGAIKRGLLCSLSAFPSFIKPGSRQTGLTGRFQKSFDMNNWHLLRKGEKL